jgi:hypothetical protein
MHLISEKIVYLVEKHSEEIVKRWITRLTIDPTTSKYNKENIEYLQSKAEDILKHLGRWISYNTTKEDIGKSFVATGAEAFKLQIPVCEYIRGMYTLRRTMWLFVLNESAFDSALQLHQMIALSDRIVLFFDRIEFYIIRGYMEEMNRKIKDVWSLNPEDTKKIFFDHSFYNK